MNRLIVKSRVGADGVLRVNVPVGQSEADREVQLTIEPTGEHPAVREDHAAWLQRVAGTWRGDFERPPQGDLEERDPLP